METAALGVRRLNFNGEGNAVHLKSRVPTQCEVIMRVGCVPKRDFSRKTTLVGFELFKTTLG